MAWGAARQAAGVGDLVARLAANDPKLTALHVMPSRRLNDQDANSLFAALARNTCLKELYVGSHAVSPAAVQALVMAMGSNRSLTSLSVGNADFGDEGIIALCQGLGSSSPIRRLDLEGKGVTAAGAVALAEVLQLSLGVPAEQREAGQQNGCSGRSSEAANSGNVLASGVTAGGSDRGSSSSSSSSGVQHLLLARNPLGDEGLAALAGGSGGLAGLRRLELQQCGVTAAGIARLAGRPAAGLSELDLAGNELGTSAGPALAALLEGHGQTLAGLALARCGLGDAGVAGLASALPAAAALRTLDLEANAVGSAGFSALAAAMPGAAHLHSLSLAGNGDADEAAVAELTRQLGASGVEQIDLGGCQVGEAAIHALARATSLTNINLFSCSLSPEAAAALTTCLSNTSTPPNHPGSFPAVAELGLAGCNLSMEAAEKLLQALWEDGAAPALRTLVLGGNPAAGDDRFEALLQRGADERPELEVLWRAGAGSELS